ncbi:MAG: hypothetical protein A2Z15_07530 [Chloroflexi bacterium RBG_16_50_11]|nr:MAG: hypothetical protein A2Z15_07530 [Chloroflexi bacterium RBG_16_50_11]
MKKAYGLVGICLLLILTSIFIGCGGGGGGATTTSAVTTQSGGQTTTQSVTTPPNVTITTATSSSFDDIPLYSGARPVSGDYSAYTQGVSGTVEGVNVEWHFYQIDASEIDAAQDFYKNAMPENGWQTLIDMDTPGMAGHYSVYMKDNGDTSAIIMTFTDPNNSSYTILGLCRTSM